MEKERNKRHTEFVDENGNELFEEAFMLTPEEIAELRAAKDIAKALGIYPDKEGKEQEGE